MPALAAETPSYSKQVRPFFSRYCLECHNAKDDQGGLDLESYAAMLEGGQHGPVLVAGKADASRMVGMVEGKLKPAMPPKKASPLVAPYRHTLPTKIFSSGTNSDFRGW